jgi:hypothetical protein
LRISCSSTVRDSQCGPQSKPIIFATSAATNVCAAVSGLVNYGTSIIWQPEPIAADVDAASTIFAVNATVYAASKFWKPMFKHVVSRAGHCTNGCVPSAYSHHNLSTEFRFATIRDSIDTVVSAAGTGNRIR